MKKETKLCSAANGYLYRESTWLWQDNHFSESAKGNGQQFQVIFDNDGIGIDKWLLLYEFAIVIRPLHCSQPIVSCMNEIPIFVCVFPFRFHLLSPFPGEKVTFFFSPCCKMLRQEKLLINFRCLFASAAAVQQQQQYNENNDFYFVMRLV